MNDNVLNAYSKAIDKYTVLTKEEEQDLAKKIKAGDEKAKEDFINANLKLVIKFADQYMGQGLELMELIQEGNIGLIDAVEKFDYKKGVKFSTYAAFWINQRIQRAIENKGKTIRIPSRKVQKIRKLNKTEKLLTQKLEREPKEIDLAREMNLSIEEIKELKQANENLTSLDVFVSEEKDIFLKDLIPDETQPFEQIIENKEIRQQLKNILEKLSEFEKEVLELYYGLNGNVYTLEEISKKLNIDIKEVKLTQKNALVKIRRFSEVKDLAIYTTNPDVSLEYIKKSRYKVKTKK